MPFLNVMVENKNQFFYFSKIVKYSLFWHFDFINKNRIL